MKTQIATIKGTWQEVVDDCRFTAGKESLGKEPSEKFKRDILIAEHSPIRDLIVKWRWKDIPSWVSVHWVRHKWECFVKTQRSDRTGVDRTRLPQDAPVDFTGEANAQHLIDTMRKRLCYQASVETRQYAEDLKMAIHEVEPDLSDVLVPNCVYRCGCPEMQTCGYWSHILRSKFRVCDLEDIQTRYQLYNKEFWRAHNGGAEMDGKNT